MLLIADSGSTKCHWALLQADGSVQRFETMGFNPFFHDSDRIAAEIMNNDGLNSLRNQITRIAYYGAGVSSADRVKIVKTALADVFSNAQSSVYHDMIGAAHATCGQNPGIACIIGTGSNSCFFDGTDISEKVPALGYILGDEASGTWLGKILLRDFLYHDLPAEMETDFIATYNLDKEDIFNRIYKQPGVNVFLASFARFLGKHKNHPYVQKHAKEGFEAFLKVHVCKFEQHQSVPVHFVGSVAFHFQDELREVCSAKGIQCGTITDEPILGLVEYYKLKA